MALEGLKGLTAQDRADWEKNYQGSLEGYTPEQLDRKFRNSMFKKKFGNREDYDTLKRLSPAQRDSLYNAEWDRENPQQSMIENLRTMPTEPVTPEELQKEDDTLNLQIMQDILQPNPMNVRYEAMEEEAKFREHSKAFDTAMRAYDEEYKANAELRDRDIMGVRQIAEQVSPYYKKYKDTEYLDLSEEDWQNIASGMNAAYELDGGEAAVAYLQDRIQQHVADKQGFWGGLGNAAKGIVTSWAGDVISFWGLVYGLMGFDYEKIDGKSAFGSYLAQIIDNSVTRYGHDVATTGSFIKSAQTAAKELGLSNVEVVQDPTKGMLQWRTIPQVIGQSGYTTASIFLGGLLKGISKGLFKGLTKGALSRATKGLTDAIEIQKAQAKALGQISRFENFSDRVILPGTIGLSEGTINALDTKEQIIEKGTRQLEDNHAKVVEQRFNELMTENPGANPEEMYSQAWNENIKYYEDGKKQVEAAATNGMMVDFVGNSIINGLIGSTLKYSVYKWAAPLADTKFLSKLKRPKFGIDGDNITNSIGKKWTNTAYIALREPIGEALEEGFQSVSSSMAQEGAYNNIGNFIKRRYNNEQVDIGGWFADDLMAAAANVDDAILSKEFLESAVYGAIGSVIGSPNIRLSDYKHLGRRQGESRLQYTRRITPWRTGIGGSIDEGRALRSQEEDLAEHLNEWFKNPENRERIKNVQGILNWVDDEEFASTAGDKYGIYNSKLGRVVETADFLHNMKGTELYNTAVGELSNIANLEIGSEEASKYIEAARKGINNNNQERSDEEILQTIKDNANTVLNTLNTIENDFKYLEEQVGYMDNDTKIALVYGKLAMEDREKREQELSQKSKEIWDSVKRKSRRKDSGLTPEQQRFIAMNGSVKNARESISKLEKQNEELQKDIDNINKRKEALKDAEKKRLIKKEVQKKLNNAIIREINTELEEAGLDENTDYILSESEIMSLPSDVRAAMVDEGNMKYRSRKQRGVIQGLLDKGKAKDINFYKYLTDAGKLYKQQLELLEEYNSILSNPDRFNQYVYDAQQEAKKVEANKKFDALSRITDYEKFSREMDKLLMLSDPMSRHIIRRLNDSNNPFFKRYKNNQEVLDEIGEEIDESEVFEDLDGNDKALLNFAFQYLSGLGIDVRDTGKVVSALAIQDSNGKTKFENYLDEINRNVPEEDRVLYTSLGELLQSYNTAVQKLENDRQEKADNAKPIAPMPTTQEQAKPTSPVVPVENPSPEEEAIDNEAKEEETEPEPVRVQSPTFQTVSNMIDNLPSVYSDEAKERAKKAIEEIANEDLQSLDHVADLLVMKANKLDIQDDELLPAVSDILRKMSNIIRREAQKEKEKSKEEEVITEEQVTSEEENTKEGKKEEEKAKIKSPLLAAQEGYMSSTMESSDIDYLRTKFGSTPVTRYWDAHKIDEYLKSHEFGRGKAAPIVYFITDDVLAKEISDDMKTNGVEYSNDDIPIIAIVEDKNGTLTIGDKRYQPIATFPSTNTRMNNHLGVGNVARIREIVSLNKSGELLRDKNGNLLVGTLMGIKAKGPDRIPSGVPNKDARELAEKTLSREERDQLSTTSLSKQKFSPIYIKAKERFMSKLKFNKEKKFFYLDVPNLKGDMKDYRIFITSVSNSTSPLTYDTLLDTISRGNASEIVNFNSRTKRATDELEKILKALPNTAEMVLNTDEEGRVEVVGEENKVAIADAEKQLTRRLNNHLVLPNLNWKYKLTPTGEVLPDNRKVFMLTVTDGMNNIPIGKVTNGNEMSDKAKANFLVNLLTEGGEVIRKNGDFDFIKWQVEYPKENASLSSVLPNISRAYDDGILELSNTGIEYSIEKVKVSSPFNSNGETAKPIQVANKDNATPIKPINTPTITSTDQIESRGAIIDSETGTVLEGKQAATKIKESTKIPEESKEEVQFDEELGLNMGRLRDKRRNRKRTKVNPRPTELPQFRGKWEDIDEFIREVDSSFDIKATKENLSKKFTEEQWNELPEEVKRHEVDCASVI